MDKKLKKTVGMKTNPVQTRDDNSKEELLREANRRALIAWDAHKENAERAKVDLAYIFGEQYQDNVDDDGRLRLTFNKLPRFVNRVVGSQQQHTHSINVVQTGGSDNPELQLLSGMKKKRTEIVQDIIRDIEYRSNAVNHYRAAFRHACESGFGYLRVLTKYSDDGFELDATIESIRDRWSVLIDPKAQEPDASDMDYCFIFERMPRREFEKRYPGKRYEPIPGTEHMMPNFWGNEDEVVIAEYFRREPVTKKIVLMSDGKTYDYKEIEPVLDEMAELGVCPVRERISHSYKVVWSKISASDILEKDMEFPTSTIPVVPVYGHIYDFSDKRRLKGLVHDAIDAQIALNKMRSSAVERIDLSPISPWIATDKSIEGYEQMWAEANRTKFSTLVFREGKEPPRRDPGATIPTAELQATGAIDADMMDIVGLPAAALGNKTNEISGVAVEARVSEAEQSTYELIANYQNAIRRVGILLTELIPQIYDTQRVLSLRGIDGSTDSVEVNVAIVDTQTGKPIVINALDKTKLNVHIESGVNYATKRKQNASQILELMKVAPQVAQVGADLLVKNLDFADSDVLSERLERTIPPQFLDPKRREEIQKDAPPPQPSPEQALVQAQSIKAQADAQKSQMDMELKKLEMQYKLQLEEIKAREAEMQYQIKQLELQAKAGDAAKKEMDAAKKEKEAVAKEVADKIEAATA